MSKVSCQENFEEIAEKLQRVQMFAILHIATLKKLDLCNFSSCATLCDKLQWIAIKHA